MTDGIARCWGRNTVGQLGDGTTTTRNRPVTVKNSAGSGALTGIAQLVTGELQTCAVMTNQTAMCWGANYRGQLGDGTTTRRLLPVQVKNGAGTGPLTGVLQVVASGRAAFPVHLHTCAVLTGQTARCWGDNNAGQLGDGTTTMRLLPVPVRNETGTGNLGGVAELAVGTTHSCARLSDGTARCWGANNAGQAGDGTTSTHGLPVKVRDVSGTGFLNGIASITAGGDATCARTTANSAPCWGVHIAADGTQPGQSTPVVVMNEVGTAPLTGITQIDASGYHTVVRLSDSTVRSWGYQYNGDGLLKVRVPPVLVLTG
jgi:alpha-tubulin suppressor-like RCC1 family protein